MTFITGTEVLRGPPEALLYSGHPPAPTLYIVQDHSSVSTVPLLLLTVPDGSKLKAARCQSQFPGH